MNNKRRKEIQMASDLLEQAKTILQSVLSDEELTYYNMPENLQSSQRGMDSEEAMEILEDVIGQLEEIA